MGLVTITIEDKLDGNVKIVATPTFESLAMKVDSGNPLTSGEAYALFALRKIREASKKQGRRSLTPVRD
jgi:hypothetical protein